MYRPNKYFEGTMVSMVYYGFCQIMSEGKIRYLNHIITIMKMENSLGSLYM